MSEHNRQSLKGAIDKIQELADSLSGDIYLVCHGDRARFIMERMEQQISEIRELATQAISLANRSDLGS